MPSYRQLRGWRRLRTIRRYCIRTVLLLAAVLWRQFLFRTTFIGVTGSIGKTTAKECIAAALSAKSRVIWTRSNDNHYRGVARTILRVRPWHQYAVVEMGIDGPGQMRWLARIVRPSIGVWLGAARTHTDAFGSLDEIAAEKSDLIRALPAGGVAILNADNLYSASYTPPDGVRTIRIGTAEGADFAARNTSSCWPQRLSFELAAGSARYLVSTQLVGTHWVPSVLAGFAVAEACGVPFEDAAARIAMLRPQSARLSPHRIPSGAVILRDDYNGSVDTLPAALRVLEDARASRRILVISDLSDDPTKLRRRFARLGRIAAEKFEAAVFLGENAERAVRAAVEAGLPPDCAHGFTSLPEAAMFLGGFLREGDVALLKGRFSDHVTRLYFALHGEVKCWRERCGKRRLCDECPELGSKDLVRIASAQL